MEFPSQSKISLAIEQQTSLFTDMNFNEYLPIERVNALIESDYLRIDSFPSKYGVFKEYANEKHQLEHYIKQYDQKSKSFKVKYFKPKHKWED
jgi:hypothetical protein